MTPEDMRNGKGKTEGYAITFYPVRWKPYSPKSQQFKRGCKGRWQKMNEYAGWDNCEPPKEVHYSPDLYAELATQAVKIAELKAERDQAVEEAQGSDEVLLQYVAQVREHEATIAAQAAEIQALKAERVKDHENINLKADFIEKTLNDCIYRAKPAPEVPEEVTLWGSIDENGVVIGAFTKHHNTHLNTHTITGTIVPIEKE